MVFSFVIPLGVLFLSWVSLPGNSVELTNTDPVEVYRVMSSLRRLFMFYLESSKLLGPNEWIFKNLTPEKN